jgi:hypothetical protein
LSDYFDDASKWEPCRVKQAPADVPRPTVIVIGLLPPVRSRLERKVRHVRLRSIPTKRDGSLVLDPPPDISVKMLEEFADEAKGYQRLLIVEVVYGKVWDRVRETTVILEELGATVVRATPGKAGWPARPKFFDNDFQNLLSLAIAEHIHRVFPSVTCESEGTEEREGVSLELLRGLVSHTKMGPNNHSHEDDLWKERKGLKPGERRRIVSSLLEAGILSRKKNDSAGGKGWVRTGSRTFNWLAKGFQVWRNTSTSRHQGASPG